MSRHAELMADPAFLKAVQGAKTALAVSRIHMDADPEAAARLIAMCTLAAFANGGGLEDPHIDRLLRFAPDLGCEAPGPHDA